MRATTTGGEWVVVVPAKRLGRAKSRILLPESQRRSLVLAMLGDTLAAVVPVAAVVAVTSDPDAAAVARASGAQVVADPGRGLNAAVRAGWADAARPAAALTGDLPGLRSDQLVAALGAARAHPYAFVPDRAATGTVLVTTTVEGHEPHFGRDSRRAHRTAGAVELAGDWPGLRCDVDTLDDLAAAAALGVGSRTAALLSAGELTRAS